MDARLGKELNENKVNKTDVAGFALSGNGSRIDLKPNNDINAQLPRLGCCYISNETEATTYHAPCPGYAIVFGESIYRYAVLFIGITSGKLYFRALAMDWKILYPQ